MSDILSDAREWLRENPVGERMGRAHDSECHRRHLECLVSRMAAEIERLREERRWVPSEERMPPDNVAVLVWHDAGGVEMAYREKGSWFMSFLGYSVSDSSYTNWQPLPAPPEDGK